MTVKQGLTSIATSDPEFSNQHIQSVLTDAAVGWIEKSRNLAIKVDASEVLTEGQKGDLNDSLETVSYLNIGRYFEDLDIHTANIVNGSLGEPDPTDGNTGTFLEHLGLVDSIQSLYESLYGQEASTNDKGTDDFMGSLRGVLTNDVTSIKDAVKFIDVRNLSTQSDYETSLQDLIDFIDNLGDSTDFDESTFNSLLSALQANASAFDVDLSGGIFESKKEILIDSRTNIMDQITQEASNLGTIRTYSNSLSDIVAYQSLASNSIINDLIVKSSTSDDWKDYFQNYEDRFEKINPLFSTTGTDEENINEAMALRGLPDVTQYLDLDSVAQKALRDVRLKATLGDSGKTSEQIIKDACDLLSIDINGKGSYTQSKLLLDNMNNNDRELIREELELHKIINTNS